MFLMFEFSSFTNICYVLMFTRFVQTMNLHEYTIFVKDIRKVVALCKTAKKKKKKNGKI